VNLTAPLDFTVSAASPGGGFGLRGKWQWRAVGGSWADVAAEVSETTQAVLTDEGAGFFAVDPGYIAVNQVRTGLTSGVDYEFQLLLRTPSGTRPRDVVGTASAVAA
jgi:hypothetical protein